MSDENPVVDQLWSQLDDASSIDDLVGVLRDVEQNERAKMLGDREGARLFRSACAELVDATRLDAKQAREVMLEYMLDRCTQSNSEAEVDIKHEYELMRELLVSWVEQYPSEAYIPLRNELLARLCPLVETEPTREAVWTTGKLGYRAGPIVDVLKRTMTREDEVGDAAIGCLLGLGVDRELRDQCTEELKRKIDAGGVRRSLLYALQECGDIGTLDWIAGLMPPPPRDEKHLPLEFASLLGTLTRIADKNVNDNSVQHRVWEVLRQYPRELFRTHQDAARCNLPDTVVGYCNMMTQTPDSPNDIGRYLLYERMLELIRPKQLEGWDKVPLGRFRAVTFVDMTHNTGASGPYVTTEMRLKESAFDASFCLGNGALTDWQSVADATADEVGLYAKASMLDNIACIQVDKIPDDVNSLIRDEYDASSGSDTGELVVRLSATRFARSSGSRQGFESLLKFGLTFDGDVLLETIDALTDLAVSRINAGDSDTIQLLLATARDRNAQVRHRKASISTLRNLSPLGKLNDECVAQIATLVSDPELDELSKAHCVECMGLYSEAIVSGNLELIVSLADSEGALGWRSLEAVARLRTRSNKMDRLLAHNLCIKEEQEGWTLSVPPLNIQSNQAYIIGLLFANEPEAFRQVVSSILQDGAPAAVQLLLPFVFDCDAKYRSHFAENVVCRALRETTRYTVESSLFEAIALIDASALVREKWNKVCWDWIPDARVALADAIGRTQYDSIDDLALGNSILRTLAFDSTYAVRRSAYRAIAALSEEALAENCDHWSRSDFVETRKRAAEAAVFLSQGSEVETRLPYDCERSVRDIFKEVPAERRRQEWASRYLTIVQEAATGEKPDVLGAYRYGLALSKMGDDQTIRALDKLIEESTLPNVRCWLGKIIKATKKSWTATTQKWPEPWFGWRGTIEQVEGEIVLPNGKTCKATFSLWRVDQSEISKLGTWGGAAHVEFGDANMGDFLNVGDIKIALPARTQADVGVTSSRLSFSDVELLQFSGSGKYPSPEE